MGPEKTGAQPLRLCAAGLAALEAPVRRPPSSPPPACAPRAARPRRMDRARLQRGSMTTSTGGELRRVDRRCRTGLVRDVFPPGDARPRARSASDVTVPIAMGDEQGGSYYPEALLRADAVDVVRIDLTCMGGITGDGRGDRSLRARRRRVRSAHVRPRPQPGLRRPRLRRRSNRVAVCPRQVDPFADSLAQPVIADVKRNALPEGRSSAPGSISSG